MAEGENLRVKRSRARRPCRIESNSEKMIASMSHGMYREVRGNSTGSVSTEFSVGTGLLARGNVSVDPPLVNRKNCGERPRQNNKEIPPRRILPPTYCLPLLLVKCLGQGHRTPFRERLIRANTPEFLPQIRANS